MLDHYITKACNFTAFEAKILRLCRYWYIKFVVGMGTICNKRGGLVRVNQAAGIDNILLGKFELDKQWEFAKSSNPKKGWRW